MKEWKPINYSLKFTFFPVTNLSLFLLRIWISSLHKLKSFVPSGTHFSNSSCQLSLRELGQRIKRGQSAWYTIAMQIAWRVFPTPISSPKRILPLWLIANSIPLFWYILSFIHVVSGTLVASYPRLSSTLIRQGYSSDLPLA